jgi:hypothetical protein
LLLLRRFVASHDLPLQQEALDVARERQLVKDLKAFRNL